LHTEKALIWHGKRPAAPRARQNGEPFYRQDLAILKLQGYAGETGDNEWPTTAAGEIVSASKQPRFHQRGKE
jgi:hypothetical protein